MNISQANGFNHRPRGLEMNVAILGVFTAQAVPLLLISLVALAMTGLVVLWRIDRAQRQMMTRRVVLQRIAVPASRRAEPIFQSAMLPASLPARAPPTFPSGRPVDDRCRCDLYRS